MHDHLWLYNAPGCHGAVQWSEDNHLAVATGHTVAILNPGALDGARAYAQAAASGSLDALLVDGVPGHPRRSESLLWGLVNEVAASEPRRASLRAIAWSPAGCTAQGGCLLTSVTKEHMVRRS
jgi:hypothetical protein